MSNLLLLEGEHIPCSTSNKIGRIVNSIIGQNIVILLHFLRYKVPRKYNIHQC